ncbi:MAG: NAD-dependent epimerase/dehydratase family protein [Candidatus Eisenbacteria bacterium]
MRLLILGGTVFLGRHVAAAAIQAGHELTLFNRGLHNPDLFPQARKLRGDRDADMRALTGGEWDAVLDTCGYLPRVVRKSVRLLSSRAGHYTFVSSISVYAGRGADDIDESCAVGTLADPSIETITAETYGPLKALCEGAVEGEMSGRALIVRPGLIVGPHDPSDRFTYWPRRLTGGGEILAPGRPQRRVQFIDVRDLAAWMLKMIEQRRSGVFNATGPSRATAMRSFLRECGEICDGRGRLVWVSDEFLQAERIAPYTELPLWIPGEDDRVDCRRAIKAGLTFRSLRATVWDTFAWDLSRPPGTALRAGLSPDREIELLRAWQAQTGAPGPGA